MEIFLRDNHSSDTPTLSAANTETERRILALLAQSYPQLATGSCEVEIIGGANVNSGNFKVGDYYIKTLKPKPGLDYVFEFPRITAAMQAAGVVALSFVRNRDGSEISERRNEAGEVELYFYVQPYVDARFYSGTVQEFQSVLQVLKLLRVATRGLTPRPGQREPFASWHPVQTMKRIASHFGANTTRPQRPFDQVARLLLDRLREYAESYRPRHQGWNELHHIDLHPHNLFFTNGRLRAVLDIESFRVIPSELATGFALFKLGRKSISNGHLDLRAFKYACLGEFDLAALFPFVQTELYRRLMLILERHYFKADHEWDSDLFKHSAGLHELEAMFL